MRIANTYADGSFASSFARQIAGLNSVSMLTYWVESGIIKPSIAGKRNRRWSFRDLVALRMIRQLRETGFSLQQVRIVATALSRYDQDFANSYLIAVADDVIIVNEQGLISALKRPGQFAMAIVFDLETAAHDVTDAIRLAA